MSVAAKKGEGGEVKGKKAIHFKKNKNVLLQHLERETHLAVLVEGLFSEPNTWRLISDPQG